MYLNTTIERKHLVQLCSRVNLNSMFHFRVTQRHFTSDCFLQYHAFTSGISVKLKTEHLVFDVIDYITFTQQKTFHFCENIGGNLSWLKLILVVNSKPFTDLQPCMQKKKEIYKLLYPATHKI